MHISMALYFLCFRKASDLQVARESHISIVESSKIRVSIALHVHPATFSEWNYEWIGHTCNRKLNRNSISCFDIISLFPFSMERKREERVGAFCHCRHGVDVGLVRKLWIYTSISIFLTCLFAFDIFRTFTCRMPNLCRAVNDSGDGTKC